MKIYLVTDGEYSDYRVLGVYDTQGKAELARDLYATENDIEEFELNQTPAHPEGLRLFEIEMCIDGNVFNCNRESVEDINYHPVQYMRRFWYGYDCEGHNTMTFYVWSENADTAIKSVNEKRAKMIAMGLWEDPISNRSKGFQAEYDKWMKLGWRKDAP